MTHKVHPKSFRIKRIEDWDTRGFYHNPALFLEEDFKIREFLEEKTGKMSVEKIEIERSPGKINIIISSSRPGLIIGRGGEGVEILRKAIMRILAKESSVKKESVKIDKPATAVATAKPQGSKNKREIRIEIREVKNPWTSASLVGQWVAQQIEKRMPFRAVLKQTISKVRANKEVQGVKVEVSGRLNGNEIARREWLKDGRLPLQTLRADIDYAQKEAYCTYGVIGIKIWIYKGEKFD